MFNGEEYVRVRSRLPVGDITDVIEDSIGRVGPVEFLDGGHFKVGTRRFRSALSEVSIRGELVESRRAGRYALYVRYSVSPSVLCWIVAVIGFFAILIGPLVLLLPLKARNDVQRAVANALREVRHEAEDADR